MQMSLFHESPEIDIIVIHDDDAEEVKLLKRIARTLLRIEKQVTPHLANIQLQRGIQTMPTPGPITLNSAGQTAATVVVGLDQFGQPFNGPIPQGTYTDDNPAAATTDANGVVTAVATGNDNATVSLTTAEGLALTASIQVIVDIPVAVPVLTTISLQQA